MIMIAHVDGFKTYTSKVLVQQLYVSMYNFQSQQFVVLLFYGTAKVKTRISVNQKLQLGF